MAVDFFCGENTQHVVLVRKPQRKKIQSSSVRGMEVSIRVNDMIGEALTRCHLSSCSIGLVAVLLDLVITPDLVIPERLV